jgi:hypothetical protein
MISGVVKLASAAFEYTGAVKALRESLDRGESLEAALRAFAAETESTVDDVAVDQAVEAIEQLSEIVTMLAARSITAELAIDQTVRTIAEEAEDVKVVISKGRDISQDIVEFLDGLRIRD